MVAMSSQTQQDGTPQRMGYNILYVRNIGDSVTSADISKLFGFHNTPELRRNTCVEIIDEEGEERYAKVVCPDYVRSEVLDMNGIEFYKQKITIVDDDDDADGKVDGMAPETSQANAEGKNDGDDILYLQLDCQSYPDLNFPRLMEYEV